RTTPSRRDPATRSTQRFHRTQPCPASLPLPELAAILVTLYDVQPAVNSTGLACRTGGVFSFVQPRNRITPSSRIVPTICAGKICCWNPHGGGAAAMSVAATGNAISAIVASDAGVFDRAR